MKRAGVYLLIAATMAFVASLLAHALQPIPGDPATDLSMPAMSLLDAPAPILLADLFLRPRNLAMQLLLALTLAALAWHALRRLRDVNRLRHAQAALSARRAARRAQGGLGPPTPGELLAWHRHDVSLSEYALLIVGLVAGAICPWLLPAYPGLGMLAALLMLAGILGAALRGVRHGHHVLKSAALGFAAGWATLVTFATFITLVQSRLGVPLDLAGAVGLALSAFAATSAQLRLGRNISYSTAVILGLIGIAAATWGANAVLAAMAVLAIAVIVFALVQVTT